VAGYKMPWQSPI